MLTASPRVAAASVAFAIAELTAAVWLATQAPLKDVWQIAVALTFALAFVSWMQLPRVHRTAALTASYWRSVCACSSTLNFVGLAAVLTAVLMEFFRQMDAEPLPIAIAAILTVRWMDAAVCGLPGPMPRPRGPLCENCGYDLTHRPSDGLCPECGFEIARSLTPRPGTRWSSGRGFHAWLATTWQVLHRPAWFYSKARLRGAAGRERRFARATYRAIALGASAWLLCVAIWVTVVETLTLNLTVFLIMAAFALFAQTGCWWGHRTIAAAVFTWWALRDPLPDGRWIAKVIAYESAFLWVFCVFWGVLASSFMMFEDWIGQWLVPGLAWWLGAPIEFWIVALGTCGLGAVWLWRYRIAYQAIRWSNF